MNNGGDRRFMARLIEKGLDVDWLQSLQAGKQLSRDSGLSRGSLRELHSRGALKKIAKDSQGRSYWSAGPFLGEYLNLAHSLMEVDR